MYRVDRRLELRQELLWEGTRLCGVVTCSFPKTCQHHNNCLGDRRKVRIQQSDTEQRISWGGCAFVHSKVIFSMYCATGSWPCRVRGKEERRHCDHREASGSRQEVRDRTRDLCDTETQGSAGALSCGTFTCTWLGQNIFLSTLFWNTLSLFYLNMKEKL